MTKLFPYMVTIALLAGCGLNSPQQTIGSITPPTPVPEVPENLLAKQYKDGFLPQLLNKTNTIDSDASRDFTMFAPQSQKVLSRSPSMSRIYQPLYAQINQWIAQSGDPKQLAKFGIQTEQLSGSDQNGNVLFTGYFSPVMELRHQPDSVFKYPVYSMPKCSSNCPTRAEIYNGALVGKGLEIGYASNMIDPFIMGVQGSGFVHFGDTDTLEYLAYAGKNNKAYVSIGKILVDQGEVAREDMSLKAIKDWVLAHDLETVHALLIQNPSYVFFTAKSTTDVVGSAGIPLLPMAAVAGDRSIFPMGTPVLAEVPLLNEDGTWTGSHQLRVLIVLDTGGAVKKSHLDLYHGMGDKAGVDAGHYKHFGRVWKLGL